MTEQNETKNTKRNTSKAKKITVRNVRAVDNGVLLQSGEMWRIAPADVVKFDVKGQMNESDFRALDTPASVFTHNDAENALNGFLHAVNKRLWTQGYVTGTAIPQDVMQQAVQREISRLFIEIKE